MGVFRDKGKAPLTIFTLITVSVLATASSLYLTTVSPASPTGEPAVILSFLAWRNGLVTHLGDDMIISILATLPLPPDMASAEGVDTRVVYSGVARDRAVIAWERLADIIEGWVRLYRGRGNDNMPYIGLIVRVDVVDKTTGAVVAAGMTSLPLDTALLSEGRAAAYTLVIEMPGDGVTGVVGVRVAGIDYYDRFTAASILAGPPSDGSAHHQPLEGFDACNSVGSGLMICYRRTYYVGVGNLTGVLPDAYIVHVGDIAYAKVPVLIGYINLSKPSPFITGTLMIPSLSFTAGIYPALFIGDGVAHALRNPATKGFPPVMPWIGDGPAWGGRGYYLYRILFLFPKPPSNAGLLYILARPYLEVFSVYLVRGEGAEYLHDEAVASVSDVLTLNNRINCSRDVAAEYAALLKVLTAASKEVYVGTIRPPSSSPTNIYLYQVYEALGLRGTDFEISVPVGAFAALFIQSLMGGSGVNASVTVTALAGVQASLSVVGEGAVSGWFQNHGAFGDVPECVNASKDVYVMVSAVGYVQHPPWWCTDCDPQYYNVSAGTYFRLD